MRNLSTCMLALVAGLLMSGAAGAWAKGAPRARVHSSRHSETAKAAKMPKAPKAPKAPKLRERQPNGEFAKKSVKKGGEKKAQ